MTGIQLTAADVALTKLQEGFVAHRYWDPDGEIWTIGYGTTSSAGVVEPIPESCTVDQATSWLLDYMNRDVVPAILARYTPPNGNVLAGLGDIGYNCGSGVFSEEPLAAALASKDLRQIADAMMPFDRAANGAVIADLYRRREADAALILRAAPPLVPPAAPKSMHYERYPEGAVRTAAQRYDALRGIAHRTDQEEKWLMERKAECARYADAFAKKATDERLKNGRPNWGNHRGFLFQQDHARGEGETVHPT